MKDINELIGKQFSHHDTWNGDYDYFIIGSIKVDENGYISLWEDKPSKYSSFPGHCYVDGEIIHSLLTKGEYIDEQEIDHCIVTRTYKIQ